MRSPARAPRPARAATLLAGLAALAACPAPSQRGDPASEGVASPGEPRELADPRAPNAPARPGLFDLVPRLEFSSPLATRLDAVPADAEAFVVVRDLRPFVDGVAAWQPMLEGPWRDLVHASARIEGLPGPTPAEFDGAAAGLVGLTRAVAGTRLALDQGLVLAWQGNAWTLLVPAGDLATIRPLLTAAGLSDTFADAHCDVVGWPTGHVVCTSTRGGATRYVPGRRGRELEAALHESLGPRSVDQAHVLARRGEGATRAELALASYPGLLHVTAHTRETEWLASLVEPGESPALGAVEPGGGFVWARLRTDRLSGLLGALPPTLSSITASLDGELALAGTSDPPGLVAMLGSTDPSLVQVSLDLLSLNPAMFPSSLPLLPDVRLEPSVLAAEDGRSYLRVDLDGERGLEGLAAAEIEPQVALVALEAHLALSLGAASEQVARALARPTELRNASAQTLPPMLVDDLLAGRAALAAHAELDALQAPGHRAHVEASLASSEGDDADTHRALVNALLPGLAALSSVSLWVGREGGRSSVHVALSSFGSPADLEGRAAREALARVLAGEEPAEVYGALAEAHPDSPRAHAYRARAGQAPGTAALASLAAIGIVASMATPGLTR